MEARDRRSHESILHTGLGAVRRIHAPDGKWRPHLLWSISRQQVFAESLRGYRETDTMMGSTRIS